VLGLRVQFGVKWLLEKSSILLAGKIIPSRLLSTTLNIAVSYVSHLFYRLFGMVVKHCLQHYGTNLNIRYRYKVWTH